MEKEFVPYDIALALKALGFNKPCVAFYNEKLELYGVNPSSFYAKNSDVSWNCKLSNLLNKSAKAKLCTAPLYQQAFRWFRKTKKVTWEHQFDDGVISLYVGEIAYPDNNLEFFETIEVAYGKYDEAFEIAQLECLKKLI